MTAYRVATDPVTFTFDVPPVTVTVTRPDDPPHDNSWFDWPCDDVLGQVYDWLTAHPEIMGCVDKVLQGLGLSRERLARPALTRRPAGS